MRIIAKRTLREFWVKYPDAEEPLRAWYREALHAEWTNPHIIKAQYRSASVLQSGRVVFNIAGNKYRLVVKIDYSREIVFIRFIGTHRQYDRINVETA